jgi:hypothetical protein
MSAWEKPGPDLATSEWREKVCAICCSCNLPLRFMEGPLCDACLDLDEVRPVRDKYYGVKSVDKNRVAEERRLAEDETRYCEEGWWDEFRGFSDDPGESGVRPSLRSTLQVDMCCLGRIVLCLPRKSTMDTMRDGLRPQKAR